VHLFLDKGRLSEKKVVLSQNLTGDMKLKKLPYFSKHTRHTCCFLFWQQR